MTSRSDQVVVKVKRLSPDAKLPVFAKDGDACADLHFLDECGGPVDVRPFESRLLGTGVAIELPPGYEAVVRGRSGLACMRGISFHVGTIDEGYRGELKVFVRNEGQSTCVFREGDRIAQLAVRPVPAVSFVEVDELSDSARGLTGFGSSGR